MPAAASDSQMIWYQCVSSAECVVVPGSCDGVKSAANKLYAAEATAWAESRREATDCKASAPTGPNAQAECLMNKCMINKGD